jgi:hypothetical protein
LPVAKEKGEVAAGKRHILVEVEAEGGTEVHCAVAEDSVLLEAMQASMQMPATD